LTAAQYGRRFVLPLIFPLFQASLAAIRYPVIVDAVQTKGMGFDGTDFSTFSILARRRVEDWQRGVTRTVKWVTKVLTTTSKLLDPFLYIRLSFWVLFGQIDS